MQTLRRIPYYGFLALLIYMPFHIFLAQSLSVVTGGLEVWKVAKDAILIGLVLFTVCLVAIRRGREKSFYWLLGSAVLFASLHLLLWVSHPHAYAESAMLGIVYNNRLFGFLLLGYGAAILNKDKFVFSSIIKIVLAVSSVVALLGIVQYFLPKDILTHFGYSLERGVRPAFFIDDNPALPRIMSTLREPNALAAYLIVPVCLLVALLAKARVRGLKLLLSGLLLVHVSALFLTFSRSAWLGVALAVMLVLWWSYSDRIKPFVKRFWPIALAVPVLLAAGLFQLRHSPLLEGYMTHATVDQTNDLDSNDYHAMLLQQGIEGVYKEPLGHGPGTAGLVSIRNPGGGQLTENYYVQIAYEVGVPGLLIFVAISVVVYLVLWRQRRQLIVVALLASFWGYVAMNMLLHTWANEAVAAQWWLLAGTALMPMLPVRSASTKKRVIS